MEPRRKKAPCGGRPSRAMNRAARSLRPLPPFPDVPTFAELGYADVTSLAWFGRSGSPNLPPQAVQRARKPPKRCDCRRSASYIWKCEMNFVFI
jgi:hypothetical protein